MNDMNIRITRRTGSIEEAIDIEFAKPQPLQLFASKIEAITRPTATPVLEWSATLCDGERVNYAKAEKACAALGEGWRLPTRFELESILDLSRHEPAIDTTRFPDTKSGYYWSSTPCAWSSDYAWIVSFYDGLVYSNRRGNSYCFVRAVRSSQ